MSLARQTRFFFLVCLFGFCFFSPIRLRCFCYLRVSLLLRRRSSFSPPLNAVIPLSPSLTAPLMFGPTGAANDALLFSSAAAIARSSPSSPAPSSVLCEGRGGRQLSGCCHLRFYLLHYLAGYLAAVFAGVIARCDRGGDLPPLRRLPGTSVREEHERRLLKLFLFQSFRSFHLNAPVLCVCVYVSNTPPFRLCDFRVRASSRFDATPQQMAAVLGAAARKLKRSAAGGGAAGM